MRRLVTRKVFSSDAFEIEAIESSEIHTGVLEGKLHATAIAKPVAIIVSDCDGEYALDLASKPLDLGALKEQLAGNHD